MQVPSETTATSLGTDMWCLQLYCCTEGSPSARDRFFGSLKQHSNERVEMVVCEWFRMQRAILDSIFKVVLTQGLMHQCS